MFMLAEKNTAMHTEVSFMLLLLGKNPQNPPDFFIYYFFIFYLV